MILNATKVQLTPTPLADLVVVNIDYFEDERGFFMESWNEKDFAAAGLGCRFVQDSHSASRFGVLRGLHYQSMQAPVSKLVRCTVGRILDVAVDLRASSLTFGKWFSMELSAKNKTLLYVPVGFAHGFATLSDYCEVQYNFGRQHLCKEPREIGGAIHGTRTRCENPSEKGGKRAAIRSSGDQWRAHSGD